MIHSLYFHKKTDLLTQSASLQFNDLDCVNRPVIYKLMQLSTIANNYTHFFCIFQLFFSFQSLTRIIPTFLIFFIPLFTLLYCTSYCTSMKKGLSDEAQTLLFSGTEDATWTHDLLIHRQGCLCHRRFWLLRFARNDNILSFRKNIKLFGGGRR